MKTIEFSDHDGTKLTLSMSSLATEEAFRIYIEGEEFIEREVNGQKIPNCIHLTRNQAEMLIHGLQDLFE